MLSLCAKMCVTAIHMGHAIEPVELENGEQVIVVTFGDNACEVSRQEFDAMERLGYITIAEAGVELTFSGRMSAMQWGRQLFTKRDGHFGWEKELARERRIKG